MRKSLLILGVAILLGTFTPTAQAATISLFEWGLNLDGTITGGPGGDPAPVGFDEITGLGTFTLSITGAGAHHVIFYVDHEIDETTNTFFNEHGVPGVGVPATLSWEIDEPGFVFGDIFANFLANTLDDTNAVPAGLEDDVAMALGWNFVLAAGEVADITFTLSTTAPAGGFYLEHHDPDSNASVYFSSSAVIKPIAVPEPGTWLLFGVTLLNLGYLRRKWG